MKPRKLWLGVVLLLIGVLMLMSNLGYLSWDFWGNLWQIWPVFLISLGLTMLLGRSRWAFVGPLVLIAAVFYAALTPGLPFVQDHFRGNMPQRVTTLHRPWDPSIEKGQLEVALGAGTVDMFTAGEQLLSGTVSYRGRSPVWSFNRREDRAIVTLVQGRSSGWFQGNRGCQSSIGLGSMIPWDVEIQLGAGTVRGDFRHIPLQSLTLEVGAGSMDLTLADKGIRGRVWIEGGVSSVTLHVPQGVGVRVHITNPIGTNNLEKAGLIRFGDYWVSDDFDTASSAYDITVSVGVGKVNLDYVLPYPRV